jgi:hypothetical protein
MTGGDPSRQLPITRNEGVLGSSPGVGSRHLQGFSGVDRCLSEGLRGPPEVYVSEVLRERGQFCRLFPYDSLSETYPAVVLSSHPESPPVEIDPKSSSEGIALRLLALAVVNSPAPSFAPRSNLPQREGRRPPTYHGLRSATGRNPRQRFWLDFAVVGVAPFATRCYWLRPLGSINAPSLVLL